MKKILAVFLLTTFGLSTHAYAQDEVTINKLATNQNTKKALEKIVADQHLPKWITQAGTVSPTQKVKIKGNQYLVMTSCKPHDCNSQKVAFIYEPTTKKIAGVFSSMNEKDGSEKLKWLSVPDNLSIDGKTILFAALTGSLDNHPNDFNFK
ncbi:Ivy family C-type lysozyme inhibitor [Commensalibacter papalotli (ex Botero et al. 2024)]|uniref:C-lysozyme inhibitor n=1 Tax=Commensalibacter papalotli (ex Botero et al. 2024) TaxID=2972766 RepID=A0ABM9HNL6_9PROT|nr:Ivy family C-type lysozyme inhibitor [Commensalibacter papalotli (ex Botero et al. 2024)]CAI3935288.1 unnamed protein product [Commensalibacter papalotli (ex Botero et al. 2024)]CAI3940442.1 unnamed protein product [Commensalibacter papalotli (ex Botero et al. 2024)]